MMQVNLQRLKRFDPKKYDQLQGLLEWCALLGLTGKDLVSLGGHIDRLQTREEVTRNLAIVRGIKVQCVGGDIKPETRCVVKTDTGKYRLDFDGYGYGDLITVTSYSTKVKRSHKINQYDLGRMNWRKRNIYSALLDWHYGHLVLDF